MRDEDRRFHEYKTWPEPFTAMRAGAKTADWRRDDRYPTPEVGDLLRFREWDPVTEEYSGVEIYAAVTYRLRSPEFEMPEGYMMICFRLGQVLHTGMTAQEAVDAPMIGTPVSGGLDAEEDVPVELAEQISNDHRAMDYREAGRS